MEIRSHGGGILSVFPYRYVGPACRGGGAERREDAPAAGLVNR
jgi:hypothetical protein